MNPFALTLAVDFYYSPSSVASWVLTPKDLGERLVLLGSCEVCPHFSLPKTAYVYKTP